MKIEQQIISGDSVPYRNRKGLTAFTPDEYPIHRLVLDHEGSIWQEQLKPGISHSKHYEWVNLGIGIIPKQSYGLRKVAYYIALGYLSGYPIGSVIYFALNFGISDRRRKHILRREGWIK